MILAQFSLLVQPQHSPVRVDISVYLTEQLSIFAAINNRSLADLSFQTRTELGWALKERADALAFRNLEGSIGTNVFCNSAVGADSVRMFDSRKTHSLGNFQCRVQTSVQSASPLSNISRCNRTAPAFQICRAMQAGGVLATSDDSFADETELVKQYGQYALGRHSTKFEENY